MLVAPTKPEDVVTALAFAEGGQAVPGVNPLSGVVEALAGGAFARPGSTSAYEVGSNPSGHAPGLFSGGKEFYGATPPGPIGRGPGFWVWDGWGGKWRSDWSHQDETGRWLGSGEN